MGPSSGFIPWELTHRILQVSTNQSRRGRRDVPRASGATGPGMGQGSAGLHTRGSGSRAGSLHPRMVSSWSDCTLPDTTAASMRGLGMAAVKGVVGGEASDGKVPTAAPSHGCSCRSSVTLWTPSTLSHRTLADAPSLGVCFWSLGFALWGVSRVFRGLLPGGANGNKLPCGLPLIQRRVLLHWPFFLLG